MNFDEAKNLLRDSYIKAGLELASESDKELCFSVSDSDSKANFWILEDEITEYAEFENSRASFKALPVECGICSPNYREQIVDFPDKERRRFVRDFNFTFGNKDNGEIFVDIDRASTTFINFFRFEEAFLQISIERLKMQAILADKRKKLKLHDMLYRPLTIRVHNIKKTSAESALETSIPIIDACLFELPYLKNITLALEEEWSRRTPRVKPFRYGEVFNGNQLPLRHVRYNPDIIRFYQRAMSSTDPVNEFLSFYQILEYFFVSVSDEQLYNRLARHINDPKLSASPSYLDRIIQDVLEHKGENDETEMLKLVFSKFVDENDLIEFIKAYESYLGESLYTKKRIIFGAELEAKLTAGHTSGNIAKRIKTIRNALVHSSDRYERKERYIPSANAENMIRREIPLLKHVAEKVIISSAE